MAADGNGPSDWELRLFKSGELATERELEILALAAGDAEIERRLGTAQPLSSDELLGRRQHLLARAADAAAAGETPVNGLLLVRIRKSWRELLERIRESLPSARPGEVEWGVRSGVEPSLDEPEESVPLFSERRLIDDMMVEISGTLIRRKGGPNRNGRRSVHRVLAISVFDAEADRGLVGYMVTVTSPQFTNARLTTNTDGIAEFRIAIGGDWLFDPGGAEDTFDVEVYQT